MRRAYSPESLVGWSIPRALPQAGMSWAFGPHGVESYVPNPPYLNVILERPLPPRASVRTVALRHSYVGYWAEAQFRKCDPGRGLGVGVLRADDWSAANSDGTLACTNQGVFARASPL